MNPIVQTLSNLDVNSRGGWLLLLLCSARSAFSELAGREKQALRGGKSICYRMATSTYDSSSILDPDETFIWDPDFPDLLNNRCRHKVNENMDLISRVPRFNANLGLDQNFIWTEKLRCSHPTSI